MAELTLQVTCTAEDGPKFKIAGEITASTDISTAIFVYKVSTLEALDEFERIATVKDLSSLVTVRGEVGTLYRRATCSIEYTDIAKAISDKAVLVGRVSLLAEQQTKFVTSFSGVTSHTLPA